MRASGGRPRGAQARKGVVPDSSDGFLSAPPPVEPMSHPDTLAASVSEPSAWGDRSAMEKTITGVLPKVTLISSPARVDLQTTKFTSEITYHIDAFTP